MKDGIISKKKFNPGDKFILEIGEKRMGLDEYEIVGTDLWVWESLLDKLTPYEPDHDARVGKLVGDCISRHAAIDALKMDISIIPFAKAREYVREAIEAIYNRLEDLPPAQPEIIRCKDCIYYDHLVNYSTIGWCRSDCETCRPVDFCSWAERRNNG